MPGNPYYQSSGTPATGAFGASAPIRNEYDLIQAGFALLPQTLTANKAVVINSLGTGMEVTVGSLALAGNFALVGGTHAVTLTSGATVNLTLPLVDGTLATLAGTETLSNKTLVAPALGTPVSGVATNLTGTASGLTVGNAAVAVLATLATNVTTNANMTGPITGTGNVTSITAQTGTGTTFVVQTSPTLITPVLGVATATSINKVAITAPASSATLTIANGKTFMVNASLTLTGTDSTTMTFPAVSDTVAALGAVQSFSAAQTFQASTTTFGIQSTTRGAIVLGNTASGSKAVTIQSSNSTTAAYTLTFPVDDGTSGQVLSTDGSGVLAWVGRGADYNLISAHTISGTEASVSFTGIDYEDLLVSVNGLIGDVATQNLRMAVSINNGSAYGLAVAVGSNNSVTTSARYYALSITGARIGFLVFNGPDSGSTTAFGINSAVSSTTGEQGSFTVGSQVNAVQFTSSSGNFTAGIITLYGR